MGYVKNNNKDLKKIKTLGIDQSFSNTGLVVMDKTGSILYAGGIATTPKDHTLEERILMITEEIKYIIRKYQVRQVSIEGLSFNSKYASTRQLAGLFYVIIHELHKHNIRYEITPPNSLKKIATGSGKSTKDEMLKVIDKDVIWTLERLSGLKSKSKKFEDIVDAYHLANLANNMI